MVKLKTGLSLMSVPNFTTLYHTVLGAAIDSERRRCVIIIRKGRNTYVASPLRGLATNNKNK